MPEFGNLINSLAGKAGISKDNDDLKRLLALADAAQLKVSDEFFAAMDNNLYTIDKTVAENKAVRGRLFAEALNGIDKLMDEAVDGFDMDEVFKAEWKHLKKNTYAKFDTLVNGLKEKIETIRTGAHPKAGKKVFIKYFGKNELSE